MTKVRGIRTDIVPVSTVVLVYNDAGARVESTYRDVELTKDQVRELAKVFRQCVESWERQKK